MNQENSDQTQASNSSNQKTITVIGDGWSAMGAVARAVQAGARVTWIAGSGARAFAPLPTLEVAFGEQGLDEWKQLALFAGLELGDAQPGTFLREFRNKAFRPSAWVNSPELEQKRETRAEMLWDPERSIAPLVEARFDLTLGEIEEKVRAHLLSLADEGGSVTRIEENPVIEVKTSKKRVTAVVLGSGEEIVGDEILFCDRWSELPKIKGLPKSLEFARKRDAVGVLQAVFHHDSPLALGVSECFYASLHKESGEQVERHVWGYFSADGLRSFWTICLSPEEAEDNHEIAKKLRRMKSALTKIFCGPTWVPEGCEDFMATVSQSNGEQVRFEEHVLFGNGEPLAEPSSVASIENLRFLTDGYGPSFALSQVASQFGQVAAEPVEGIAAQPSGEREPEAGAS